MTPSIQSAEVTLTAKFTAVVTGVGPFTYQWQRGNEILTDEIRNTYIVYNASRVDQNHYSCLVTNKLGHSVTSNRVWLEITSTHVFMMSVSVYFFIL